MPLVNVGRAVRLARERHFLPHQRAGQRGVVETLIAIEAGGFREVGPMGIELEIEGVIKAPAAAPQEFDAELPRRLGEFVEALAGNAEVFEEMPGEIRRGALADADDADGWAAHDPHLELGDSPLDGYGGDETGAAGAEDEDVLDHGFGSIDCLGMDLVEVSPRTGQRRNRVSGAQQTA